MTPGAPTPVPQPGTPGTHPTMGWQRLICAGFIGIALGTVGCGGETATPESTPTPAQEQDGALGGAAATATLARAGEVTVPDGTVAWVAHEVTLESGDELRHEHSFSTVYAREGTHELSTGGSDQSLAAGEGAAVPAGSPHVHGAPPESPSVFWEVRLAEPGSQLPGAPRAEPLFESEPLEGVPDSPLMQFIRVDLPPGTETSVHTHPGPEFIYGTRGRFTYENGIEGEREFGPRDEAGIPPDTPVQKRNATTADASFLSWFLVDPDQPFAPGAEFD